jgi:2-polyprenyl-6-methoxyphenol hydroxylase-like FAD-dependent oxidoreductase
MCADDAGPARDIIVATTDELAAFPVYDMPVVPTWHRDSMVIIGDAAHATSPSSGQGASLAIEDAIVLAKCLRDCDGIAQAFTTYERLRRQRVERVVAYSARIGQSKTVGAAGRWFRDLLMPLALKVFASRTRMRGCTGITSTGVSEWPDAAWPRRGRAADTPRQKIVPAAFTARRFSSAI